MKNKEIRGMTEVANRLVTLYELYVEKGQSIFLKEYTELLKVAIDIDLLYFAAKCSNKNNAIEVYLRVKDRKLIYTLPRYVIYNITFASEQIQRIEELRISKILPN